jgi:hypothetical protein
MKKIPTAKKVYHIVTGCVLESHHNPDIEKAMIEFAKFHVKAALKEASKKSKNKEGQIIDHKLTNSILNSYSLDNIK